MKNFLLALLLLCPLSALAQYSVWSEPIQDNLGNAIVGATVAVCNLPAPTLVTPCGGTTLATIYSSFAGGAQSNPIFTDSNGRAPVFAVNSNYYLQVYGPGLQTTLIAISVGAGGGNTPPPGQFSVTPSAVAFGGVALGTTSPPSPTPPVMLTNNSGVTVTGITIGAPGVPNGADFTIVNNTCGTSLAAGAQCGFQIQFTPTIANLETSVITITDSVGTQTVSLSGTGFGAGVLSISPTSLTFGNQAVGSPSTPQVITITNQGTAPIVFTSIVASGDYSDTTTCSFKIPLPQTQSCTVSVVFTPTTTGTRTGAITFTDSAVGSPQVVTLTGTGTANNTYIASMAITPTNPSINLPGTQQFTGIATLSSGGTLNTPNLPALWNASGASGVSVIAEANINLKTLQAQNASFSAQTTTAGNTMVVIQNTALGTQLVPTNSVDAATFTQACSNTVGSTTTAIYTASLAGGTSNVVTVHSSISNLMAAVLIELTNVAASNFVDACSIAGAVSPATANMSVPAMTTTGVDAIVCGGTDPSTGGITPGVLYTSSGSVQTGWAETEEWLLNTPAGSYTGQMTDAASTTTWSEGCIAVKAAGGGGADASINSTGLATALATGSSTITVAQGPYYQANSLPVNANVEVVNGEYLNVQAAGDLNIVAIGWADASSPSTHGCTAPTDTAGNTYTAITPITGTLLAQAVYYSNGIIAYPAGNQVTFNCVTSSLTTPTILLAEYTIGGTGTVLDVSASSAGTTSCGTSVTTVNPPDLIVSICAAAAALSSASSPLIPRIGPISGGVFMELADNSALNNTSFFAAAGAQSYTIPVASSAHFVNTTLGFKVVHASTTLTISSGTQNTYYVSPTGSDSNNGTSISTPWLTMCHADANFTLGTNGTNIILLPGTYIINQQGSCYSNGLLMIGTGSNYSTTSSTAHVVWMGQNDPRTNSNSSILNGQNNPSNIYVLANQYVDFKYLEITGAIISLGDSAHNTATSDNFGTIQYNYLHDAFNTCQTLYVGVGGFIYTDWTNHDALIDGNVVNNIGVVGGCPGGTTGPHGIYIAGYHSTVTNNLVSNSQAYGIQSYHNACESNITNNTLVHNAIDGIELSRGPNTSYGCNSNGGNWYTVDNNIIYLNGWGCGVNVVGNSGTVGGFVIYDTGNAAVNSVADNNFLIGNFFGSGAGCTSVQGGNNFYISICDSGCPSAPPNGALLGTGPTSFAGLPTISFKNPCPPSTWGVGQGAGGSTPPCNVIPKARGGVYDWSLALGSTFIGAGGSGAAGSPGFSPPVVPTYDINGILRNSPTAVGAYE